MMLQHLLHYFACSLGLFLSTIGTGIGQGIAGAYSLDSLSRQTLGSDSAFRAMIIGLALIESGCIFALVISLLLIVTPISTVTLGVALAEVGIGIAIGISSAVVGIASSFVIKGAVQSMTRQPFFSQNILMLMLLSQSIIEAPVIFSFIIALIIKNATQNALLIPMGIQFLSSGISIALGSIGPALGQAIFSHSLQRSIGKNSSAFKNLFTFSLLNQAVIETPVIFSLLVSFLIIYIPSIDFKISASFSLLSAAFAMGFGALGTGFANGYVGSKGCEPIALNPVSYASILRATLLSQAIIEASVIYAFIISLLLISSV